MRHGDFSDIAPAAATLAMQRNRVTVQPFPREIAPPEARRVVMFWTRSLPGEWVPVEKLCRFIRLYGAEVVEAAVEQLGERGTLSLETIPPAVYLLARERQREARRERQD